LLSATSAGTAGNIFISDLKIYNNSSGAGCHGIRISAVAYARVYIQRVWIDGMTGSGIHGTALSQSNISDCVIENCGADGIYLTGATRTEIYRNRIEDNASSGVEIVSCQDTIVNSNIVYDNGVDGLYFDSCARTSVFANSFYRNSINARVSGALDASIFGNHFIEGSLAGNPGLAILADTTERVTISGNLTRLNPSGGMTQGATVGTWIKFYHNYNAESPEITLSPTLLSAASGDSARNDLYSEFIDADEFIANGGAPTKTYAGVSANPPVVWSLPAGALSSVGVWWRVPSNLIASTSAINLRIFPLFYSLPAVAQVVLGVNYLICSPGISTTAALTTTGDVVCNLTTGTARSAYARTSNVALLTIAVPALIVGSGTPALRITIYRNGASGSDTYGSALLMTGVEVNFE
jgi:parallel beta-helix repeat protein